ncbi:MAG: hypothetical protein BWX93_01628 [Bacteroidetes bacterium ADurb.Bin139]|nr:MAG: hypothetical protein BWX93_01628 [Bacteroidetes bacterium ADurb.Bin139]
MTVGIGIAVAHIGDHIVACFFQAAQFDLVRQGQILEITLQRLSFVHAAYVMHPGLEFNPFTHKSLKASSWQ